VERLEAEHQAALEPEPIKPATPEEAQQHFDKAAAALDRDTAHWLTTSSAIDTATAFHGLPGAPQHIPANALRPLAELDVKFLT
jgi:hypothetical protein